MRILTDQDIIEALTSACDQLAAALARNARLQPTPPTHGPRRFRDPQAHEAMNAYDLAMRLKDDKEHQT